MRLPSEREPDSKAEITAILGAFCFFLSAVEYMLPKPMPFMRLGIANLPILLAIDILPFGWFLTLALVKVIGMSLISGSLFSYVALFSLAGTMIAALAMWASRKAGGRFISRISVSALGAVASNAVQILIATVLVFGKAAWLISPLFLATGLLTGTALGIFAERFAKRSAWYAMASGKPAAEAAAENSAGAAGREAVPGLDRPESRFAARFKSLFEARRGAKAEKRREARTKASAEKDKARMARKARWDAIFDPRYLALVGAFLSLVLLFERTLWVKLGLMCFFAVAVSLSGKRFSFITMLMVSAGIVLTNLLVPSGRVLASIGPFAITEFALVEGLSKAITFEGLMLASKASIRQGLKIPGRLGAIVGAAFGYYDRIVEYKGKIRASSLAADADAMMSSVWMEGDRAAGAAEDADGAADKGAVGIDAAGLGETDADGQGAASAAESARRGIADGSRLAGNLALAFCAAAGFVLSAMF